LTSDYTESVPLEHGGVACMLRELGFKSCLADLDVYTRPNVKPCGTHYYEYALVYDVLVVSHNPISIMDELGKWYTLKERSIHELT
jgi:hypothetical protein